MSTRTNIASYIHKADYQALINTASKEQAKTLKYTQSHIYGDMDEATRWYAITAFGKLAKTYADEHDEAYRNILRRCLWAMNDESGNVPWSSPEVMASIIKAAPKYSYDFTAPMLTNGLDNPMCHRGVLWAIGHLGTDFSAELAQFLPQVTFALNSKDAALRGFAIWAFIQTAYLAPKETIAELTNDNAEFHLFSDGQLKKTTVSALAQKYLEEFK